MKNYFSQTIFRFIQSHFGYSKLYLYLQKNKGFDRGGFELYVKSKEILLLLYFLTTIK